MTTKRVAKENINEYSNNSINSDITGNLTGNVTGNLVGNINNLLRSTAYSVGDIAFSTAIKSYNYLECTTAGTTDSAIPSTLSSATLGG